MIGPAVFWLFQVLNGLTAIALSTVPKRFHETMIEDPERAYGRLGFSPTALEMLHNVLRGQGAALLAITVFLFYVGPSARQSYLLIGIACGLTLVAHVETLRHHRNSAVVRTAIKSLSAMYVMIAINLILSGAAFWVFFAGG